MISPIVPSGAPPIGRSTQETSDSQRQTQVIEERYDNRRLKHRWHLKRDATGTLILEGKCIAWYPNGQKQFEMEFLDGKPEGGFIGWFEHGGKQVDGQFREGMMEGNSTAWHANGQKWSEIEVRGGVLHGRQSSWFPNGSKFTEGEYKDGRPYGTRRVWTLDGAHLCDVEYLEGGRVRLTLANGSVRETTEDNMKNLHVALFPEVGPIRSEPPTPADGRKLTWEAYYQAGRVAGFVLNQLTDGADLLRSASQIAVHFDEKDTRLAVSLFNLGILYMFQGNYVATTSALAQALPAYESSVGAEHTAVGTTLLSLGIAYRELSRYIEAEPLLRRAMVVLEKVWGADHASVSVSLTALADLYFNQSRFIDATPLYNRAIAIWERPPGRNEPAVDLWAFFLRVGKKDAHGREQPDLPEILERYSICLREMNRADEADRVDRRAKALRHMYGAAERTSSGVRF